MGMSSNSIVREEDKEAISLIRNEQIIKKGEALNLKNIKLLGEKAEASACKIIKDFGYGSGFFCKIIYPDKNTKINCLITNNHVLTRHLLKE